MKNELSLSQSLETSSCQQIRSFGIPLNPDWLIPSSHFSADIVIMLQKIQLIQFLLTLPIPAEALYNYCN